ncbi:MAG TPA: transglycosylase SLT domain-containing protein [Anaerolineales bacterium]|nr:transglycosylase SLT domain-containing protein [Anaerolineales bacterium]
MMPRARSQPYEEWQTAAANEDGSGCLSVYLVTPLAVLVIAGFLTILALKMPTPTAALVQAAAPALQQAAPAPVVSVDHSVYSSGLSPIFTKEVQHWGADIVRWAHAAGVDPNLAATVMQIESCGDPRALSRAGASGLFQVMPFHFHVGENPFNPDTNALRGMDYLSRSLEAGGGNPRLALAGYNGGIGVISRSERNWPAETKRYVYYGAPIYEDARSGASSSPMLDEWYRKYGAGLCNQASQRLGLP